MIKKLFWSYENKPKNINILIEHSLRYEDLDGIKQILEKYGYEKCKDVWEKLLLPDPRLKKLNYFLAKYIFNISENDEEIRAYFIKHKQTRLDRLNEVFNQ